VLVVLAAKEEVVPKPLKSLKDFNIIKIAAGAEHSLAVAETGELFAWGASGALDWPLI
jgi:alpha-tubulin suppressor-like RCC1 family protein